MKKCHAAVQKYQTVLKHNPEFHPSLSEATLHNLICFCLAAHAYEDALQFTDTLKTFQADRLPSTETPYHIYQMMAYVSLFPKQRPSNPAHLIQQVHHFLKTAPKGTVWACITLAEFCLLYNDWETAAAVLEHPLLPDYCAQYEQPFYTPELVQLAQTRNKQGLKQLVAVLEEQWSKAPSSALRFHYESTLKIARHLEEQL